MRLMLVCLSIVVSLSISKPATAADMMETARGLLVEFTEAVITGPQAVAPLLAPEYQIMRTNGVGYNRDEYIDVGVSTLSFKPDFSHEELHVTHQDGVMVVRYFLIINEKIDGNQISRRAPRLTVFRQIDGDWKVVAHANFATFEQ